MKHPTCAPCKQKAEFYFQKDGKGRMRDFCEDHALDFIKKEKVNFLPRV